MTNQYPKCGTIRNKNGNTHYENNRVFIILFEIFCIIKNMYGWLDSIKPVQELFTKIDVKMYAEITQNHL